MKGLGLDCICESLEDRRQLLAIVDIPIWRSCDLFGDAQAVGISSSNATSYRPPSQRGDDSGLGNGM